jgi:ubiquitin-protein ligase
MSSTNSSSDAASTTTSATTAQRRLMRDLRDLTQNPVEGINAAPTSPDNIFQWNAILDGPEDSLFEDASFVLTLKFPQDYPNHPPAVKFVTKVFHPNICKIEFFKNFKQ